MAKDFERWHIAKSILEDASRKALFREREIWWCILGANVGYEQDGSGTEFTRPVLIIKKFNLESCLVIPLTSRQKSGKYYFPIGEVEGKQATAILSQIRFIDSKRLLVKSMKIKESIFIELVQRIVSVCLTADTV